MLPTEVLSNVIVVVRGTRGGDARPLAGAPDPACIIEEHLFRAVFPVPPKLAVDADHSGVVRWTAADEELEAELSVRVCADPYEALDRLELDHAWELRQRGHDVVTDARDALGAAPARVITTVREGVVLQLRESAWGKHLVRATAVHRDADVKAARFLRSLVCVDQPEDLAGAQFTARFPVLSRGSVEGEFVVHRATTDDGAFVLEYFDAASVGDALVAMLTEDQLAGLPEFLAVNTTRTAESVFRRHDHEIVFSSSSVLVREFVVRRRLYRLYATSRAATASAKFLDEFRLREARHVVITPGFSFGFPGPTAVERVGDVIRHHLISPEGSFEATQRPAAGEPEDVFTNYLKGVAREHGVEGGYSVVRNEIGSDPVFTFAVQTGDTAIQGRCAIVADQAYAIVAVTPSAPESVAIGHAVVSELRLGSEPAVVMDGGRFVVANRWYRVPFAAQPKRTVYDRRTDFDLQHAGLTQKVCDLRTDTPLEEYVESWRFEHIAQGGVVLGDRRGTVGIYPFRDVCYAPSYDGQRTVSRFTRVYGSIVCLTEQRAGSSSIDFIQSIIL